MSRFDRPGWFKSDNSDFPNLMVDEFCGPDGNENWSPSWDDHQLNEVIDIMMSGGFALRATKFDGYKVGFHHYLSNEPNFADGETYNEAVLKAALAAKGIKHETTE